MKSKTIILGSKNKLVVESYLQEKATTSLFAINIRNYHTGLIALFDHHRNNSEQRKLFTAIEKGSYNKIIG